MGSPGDAIAGWLASPILTGIMSYPFYSCAYVGGLGYLSYGHFFAISSIEEVLTCVII